MEIAVLTMSSVTTVRLFRVALLRPRNPRAQSLSLLSLLVLKVLPDPSADISAS
jgi:hypothetical protein